MRLVPLAHTQAFQPLGPCRSSYQECLSSLSLPPFSILLLSLFNLNAASSRKALLRALFQQTRTQIQRHQKGQISACRGFGYLLLGYTHTLERWSPLPRSTPKCPLGGDRMTRSPRRCARREANKVQGHSFISSTSISEHLPRARL